jgi:hypothetical protein
LRRQRETITAEALVIRGVVANRTGNAVTNNPVKPLRNNMEERVPGMITVANGASSSVNTSMIVK